MAKIPGIPAFPKPKPVGPMRTPTAVRPVMQAPKNVATQIVGGSLQRVNPQPRPDPAPGARGPIRYPYHPPGQVMRPIGGPQFGTAPGRPPAPPGSPAAGAAPPPAAAPPAAVAPPPPPDLMALLTDDERWKKRMIDVAAQRNQLMGQYGFNLDGSVAPESANPDSIVSQIARGFRGNVAGLQNDLNSRGILFSGANQEGVAGLGRQRDSDIAQQNVAFNAGLTGIDQGSSDLFNAIYGDLLQKQGTLTPEPAAAEAGGTAGGGAGGSTATPAINAATRQTNNSAANKALAKATSKEALAKLYNTWKGKVDDSVLRAIDAKLKAARVSPPVVTQIVGGSLHRQKG